MLILLVSVMKRKGLMYIDQIGRWKTSQADELCELEDRLASMFRRKINIKNKIKIN